MDINEVVANLKSNGKDFAARRALITTHMPVILQELKANPPQRGDFAKGASINMFFRTKFELFLDRTENMLLSEAYRKNFGNAPAPQPKRTKRMAITTSTSTGIDERPFIHSRSTRYG